MLECWLNILQEFHKALLAFKRISDDIKQYRDRNSISSTNKAFKSSLDVL